MNTALIDQSNLTISSLKDLMARTLAMSKVQVSALDYLRVLQKDHTEKPLSAAETAAEQANIAELAEIFDNLSEATDTAIVGIMVTLSKLEKIDDKD